MLMLHVLRAADGHHLGYELSKWTRKGRILTIDMGDTDIRVCDVHLGSTKREFEQTQKKYRLPAEIKIATAEQLWD